jgi:hypothetical protein
MSAVIHRQPDEKGGIFGGILRKVQGHVPKVSGYCGKMAVGTTSVESETATDASPFHATSRVAGATSEGILMLPYARHMLRSINLRDT